MTAALLLNQLGGHDLAPTDTSKTSKLYKSDPLSLSYGEKNVKNATRASEEMTSTRQHMGEFCPRDYPLSICSLSNVGYFLTVFLCLDTWGN